MARAGCAASVSSLTVCCNGHPRKSFDSAHFTTQSKNLSARRVGEVRLDARAGVHGPALEVRRHELVFAAEVLIERRLRRVGLRQDAVDSHGPDTLPVEKAIGGAEEAITDADFGGLRPSLHFLRHPLTIQTDRSTVNGVNRQNGLFLASHSGLQKCRPPLKPCRLTVGEGAPSLTALESHRETASMKAFILDRHGSTDRFALATCQARSCSGQDARLSSAIHTASGSNV